MNQDDVAFYTAELATAARARHRRRPIFHYTTEAGIQRARFNCGRTGHVDHPGTPGHVTVFPTHFADLIGRPCLQCLQAGGMLA